MGQLTIETHGSFPTHRVVFSALDHGHAHAVAQAIAWMSDELLPEAIQLDHRLHDQGSKPELGFDAP